MTFWMICARPTHPNARTEPRARYGSRDSARDDASRLAAETGRDFVILESVEIVRPGDTDTPPLL